MHVQAAHPWKRIHWSSLPLSADSTARASSEHVFQMGNDRLVVIANNYGAVRVRQDEGSPKWLTDSQVAADAGTGVAGTQFGGGFGVLSSGGAPILTTYFNGLNATATKGSARREFGIGFAATAADAPGWKVRHLAAVPVGDDPVVVIEVTVENSGTKAASARWTECFSSFMVQMDPDSARLPGISRRNFSEALQCGAASSLTRCPCYLNK